MKKTLVLIFLFSIFTNLNSQTVTIFKKIEWNQEKKKEVFENISYKNDLPLYSTTVNLSKAGINSNSVSIEIIPKKTEKVEIKNNEFISSKIDFIQSVFYGRDVPYLNLSFHPYIKKSGIVYKIIDFELKIIAKENKLLKNNPVYKSNSVLNFGTWVKIAIPERGIYKITNSELESLGFSNPGSVRVFGNDVGELSFWNEYFVDNDLIENKIYKGSDYILFFAEGAEKWFYNESKEMFEIQKNSFSDTAYYYLTDKNTGFSNSISNISQPTQTESATITNYDYFASYEEETINILHSGRIWLGESFLYEQQKTFNFEIPNYVSGSNAKIRISTAARAFSNSTMNYSFAGNNKTVTFDDVDGAHHLKYVDPLTNYYDFILNTESLDVDLKYNKPTSSAEAWIDKIILNAKRELKYSDGQMIFRSRDNVGKNNYSKFKISSGNSNLMIWNINNPTQPENIQYDISGTTLSFKIKTDTVKEFIVFDVTNCLTPVFEGNSLGNIENQDLHNVSSNIDMLVITPAEFELQANQFAQIHRDYDDYNVLVVKTNEIYNEFGCGQAGAPPIRDYIRMVYEKTNKNLRYVLLFGDGTYNNKADISEFNPNYIPTYQTFNSFNTDGISTTSDDFYALLDNDEGEYTGKLDLAVGRMPIKNTQEADEMVAKIQMYYSNQSYGDWRNIVTLLADDWDESGDNFVDDSEIIANKVNQNMPYMNIKKIYLDAYMQQSSANGEEYPDAVTELNNRVNNGSLIVNYIGHGSEEALSGERVVTRQIINNWNNFEALALFITGTCSFSRYDDASTTEDKTSAGEMVVLNPNGGAIVMLTTARVSYSGTNLSLNNNFYDYLFSKNGDDYLKIGDAYFMAKNDMNNDTNNSYNALFFTLLGDPAIKLMYAENKIHTTKINAVEIENYSDTLRALDRVTINGFVSDDNDVLLRDFNGTLTLTFFDKKQDFQTLNNDGNGSVPFWTQYNKLFRGRASVTNGNFDISFIIPRDIIYSYGKPKFSYYANTTNKQATGYYEDITLGGINPDAEEDNQGPKIRLFMNDSSFVTGGMTDPNPSVFAILSDENGINTSSASFGHDILATLDDNPNKAYSLNEYYQSDIDNYKQGTVDYGLFKLAPGNHTVSLKAWDTYNNSSEKTITFVVTEDNELILKHLLNYPNPFTTNTDFYFEHNKPGIYLDVLLQIFTVSGKLVKTIHQPMTTTGYRSEPINWDGLDDFGNKIGSGVYIYRVKIRTPDGKTAEEYEKVLILK